MVMIEVSEGQASVLSYLVTDAIAQQRQALDKSEAANIQSKASARYQENLKASIAELQRISLAIAEAVG